jgi:hypothetical protein
MSNNQPKTDRSELEALVDILHDIANGKGWHTIPPGQGQNLAEIILTERGLWQIVPEFTDPELKKRFEESLAILEGRLPPRTRP